MPKLRNLNKDFFKTWSSDMAYVLGFFAADGSMLLNKRGAAFIEFTTTDRVLLSHIQAAVSSNHSIQRRDRKNRAWKVQYRLQIGSKDWFNDLEKLGFTQRKSSTLRFPRIAPEFMSDFIRGYFDGDGCIYLRIPSSHAASGQKAIMSTLFTSGSREFLHTLWNVLKREGIQGGSLVVKNRGFELKFSKYDSVALYKYLYHTAEDPIRFLPRKRKKFDRGLRSLKILRE